MPISHISRLTRLPRRSAGAVGVCNGAVWCWLLLWRGRRSCPDRSRVGLAKEVLEAHQWPRRVRNIPSSPVRTSAASVPLLNLGRSAKPNAPPKPLSRVSRCAIRVALGDVVALGGRQSVIPWGRNACVISPPEGVRRCDEGVVARSFAVVPITPWTPWAVATSTMVAVLGPLD